jgi:hypothetical protein
MLQKDPPSFQNRVKCREGWNMKKSLWPNRNKSMRRISSSILTQRQVFQSRAKSHKKERRKETR